MDYPAEKGIMSTPAVVPAVTPVVSDPWLDPFTQLGREGYFQDITQIAADEGFGTPDAPAPEAPDAPLAPLVVPPVEPVIPAPEIEPEGPRVFPVDGGGTLTMEKGSKGWQATLTAEGLKDQVYYGKTKDELLLNFGKAQLHATKKIRAQDQKLKLGDPVPSPVAAPPPPGQPISVRELTADERFEYKTLLDSDPVRALDFYNEKRYGLTPEQFAQRLNQPLVTHQQTTQSNANATASRFVDTNKDFYPDPEGSNYLTMVRYLGRNYLNRVVTKSTASATVEALQEAGFWTLENLEAAKDDLNESGLLLSKPVASTPAPIEPVAVPPQPAPVPPVAAPVPPRAIPPVERPRAANLGLRVQGAPAPTPDPAALSVDDPSNMSDEDLDKVMSTLRQSRLRGR